MPTMDNLMNNKAAMLGLSVLAFLVAAVLVITIFRMLVGGRLRMPGGRARQARLGIVDAFDLDRQRQLIIVRRDNTEHLIMIGGPNDVVIESEIVRAEARDLREARRDPVVSPGDGRIPAPVGTVPSPQSPERPAARPADEPRVLVTAMSPTGASEPSRAPTFPFPARRPAPTAPERRPAAPPKLPDSVSRGDEAASAAIRPTTPAPVPSAAPSAPPPQPGIKPPPTMPSAAPPPMSPTAGSSSAAPAPGARPPFLKPLTPRPPVRPLPRTTPQALPGANPLSSNPQSSAAPARPAPSPGSVSPAQNVPAAAPQTAPTSSDALESLEEEMAKLLGRGS